MKPSAPITPHTPFPLADKFRADGSEERKVYRAQATAGNERMRLAITEMLDLPNLVLADVSNGYCLPILRGAADIVDRILSVKMPIVRKALYLAHSRVALYLGCLAPPLE